MEYISTRNIAATACSSAQAIIAGIAPDGGLYVPKNFPAYDLAKLKDNDYLGLAKDIFGLYLSDFNKQQIEAIVKAAYPESAFGRDIAPVQKVGDFYLLELFHGPTAAFKDMALQALPHLLTTSMALTGQKDDVVILVATSGDTGKAALEGFCDVEHCSIIVFYPADGVSEIQEKQMLTTGGQNTTIIAVNGNFDDCQTAVKQVFADQQLATKMANHNLSFSSANSINFGRLLPQIVYYFDAYRQLCLKHNLPLGEAIDVAVPTGNFGNILAAFYAKQMGLPIANLICASNSNDVLADAISTGLYNRKRPFYQTGSPSMDILVSSNFERFLYEIYGRDAAATANAMQKLNSEGQFTIEAETCQKMQALIYGGKADDQQAAVTIKDIFAKHNYVLDPHTAVGYYVAQQYQAETAAKRPLVLASTASPYKFANTVLKALDIDCQGLNGSEQLQLLAQKTVTNIPNSLAKINNLPQRVKTIINKEEIAATVAKVLELK